MRRLIVPLSAVVALLAGTLGPASGAGFDNLEPGKRASLREEVPVNFVFVGYDEGLVDEGSFLAGLPSVYRPVIRSRLWYGVTDYLGITYTYDYDVTFTGAAWEDDFFGALSDMAEPADLTLFQQYYNAQIKNVLNVTDNRFIDAPSVEKWLIDHAPAGVDTSEDTVFFINWWGRDDFVHHVYTKFGEPDPDTGYDFGVNRQSRRIIAWGGTTPEDEETGLGAGRGVNRVWFHDLSAGPESWTDNWNVDRKDVDGDGVADYRMPPIWEYLTPGGYRDASALTGDLAKVARYVAIDLLFTTSPLYPPVLTPPRLPTTVNVDNNTYEAWPGVDVSEEYVTPALVHDELSELDPAVTGYDDQDLALEGKAAYCFYRFLKNTRCYNKLPQYPGFANLFLYAAKNRDAFLDGGGDYEAMMFSYGTEFEAGGLLGFADDNWKDGTQSFVFNFVDPVTAGVYGYGLSTTQIHEFGHHIGMSHPHDGWDYERRIDFDPSGAFYFAWSGDESNSIMSYIDLNWDFSQFDRDNYQRAMAAAAVTNVNGIAAAVLASDDAVAGMAHLNAADDHVGMAEAAFADHDYEAARDHALEAYSHAALAAEAAGVAVEASDNGWYVQPPRNEWHGPMAKKGYAYRDRIGPNTHRGRM